MSIVGHFNKLFGIQPNLDEERKQFVNRTNQTFHLIDTESRNEFKYNELFDKLCFALGRNANDLRREDRGEVSEFELLDEQYDPEIRILTKDDFIETLRVLCVLYEIFKRREDVIRELGIQLIDARISNALSQATCDLGVRWKDGLFYPSGAEELDKALIEEPLVWLDKYPNEREDYKRALDCYVEGTHLGDVVRNCYTALEGVSRAILRNSKTLDNNKDALLAIIELSDGWKSILGAYINYAHDFRHASEGRYTASKEEAEAFLYMTGLIMRLLISKK